MVGILLQLNDTVSRVTVWPSPRVPPGTTRRATTRASPPFSSSNRTCHAGGAASSVDSERRERERPAVSRKAQAGGGRPVRDRRAAEQRTPRPGRALLLARGEDALRRITARPDRRRPVRRIRGPPRSQPRARSPAMTAPANPTDGRRRPTPRPFGGRGDRRSDARERPGRDVPRRGGRRPPRAPATRKAHR